MIKIENTITPSAEQWKSIILGARNAMNSWQKSDLKICNAIMRSREILPGVEETYYERCEPYISIGENDMGLMMKLAKAGTDHRKFMRMITVYVDITAPLYFWKEFDTYKVGTVANSCSTMHKIHDKEFTLEDFSCEHLIDDPVSEAKVKELEDEVKDRDDYSEARVMQDGYFCYDHETGYLAYAVPHDDSNVITFYYSPKNVLKTFIIPVLNANRKAYLETKDKKYWWQLIQLLPSSYNQKRTVMLNYEVLANIYKSRKNHKLDCWHDFCSWIYALPYNELITGDDGNAD